MTRYTETDNRPMAAIESYLRDRIRALTTMVNKQKEELKMAYTLSEMTLPDDLKETIDRYIEHGVPTGGFLEAVICNDLKEACGRADEQNLRIIPAIVSYFYNEAPMACWGKPDSFQNWIDKKREERNR
jgi:hypothetical protein